MSVSRARGIVAPLFCRKPTGWVSVWLWSRPRDHGAVRPERGLADETTATRKRPAASFRPGVVALAVAAALLAAHPARGGAEVALDREFIAGLVEKVPPAAFQKAGQYRGSARGFRL